MIKKFDSNKARLKRHRRVRAKISGTPERPRLNVFRSSKHIYAQLIDDVNGVTLASASSMDKSFEGNGGNADGARKVGEMIAKNQLIRYKRSCFRQGGYLTTAVYRLSLRVLVKTD